MKPKTDSSPPAIGSDSSCITGSCGGPGLCPGVALFIAYAVGVGLAALTGLQWLSWAIGIPLALILITGNSAGSRKNFEMNQLNESPEENLSSPVNFMIS